MTRLQVGALVVAAGLVGMPGLKTRPPDVRGASGLKAGPPEATAEVCVVVERADETGVFVRGLTRDDVQIVVDGAPVYVEDVQSTDEPVSLLVLVDLTYSATFPSPESSPGSRGAAIPHAAIPHDLRGIVEGIERALVPALRPADRFRVGRFAGRQVMLSPAFETDRSRQLAAVRPVLNLNDVSPEDRFGATPIWDAVAATATGLGTEIGPRAIILVTDGEATGNRMSMSDAAREAVEHGVPVHVVFEKWQWSRRYAPPPWNTGDLFLRPLAEQTGGLFRVDDHLVRPGWRDPPPPFKDLLEAMHSVYRVRFSVSGMTQGTKSLDVRVKRPGVLVHAPNWVVVKGE